MIVGYGRVRGNTCNDCDPPIPDTLYVTFAGLAGDFADWNGKHTLTWVYACTWVYNFPTEPYLHFSWGGDYWAVYLVLEPPCNIQFRRYGHEYMCNPDVAGYTQCNCTDATCEDTDSCEDSAGATCVVSLT